MKRKYRHFYRLTEDQLKKLFSECFFVIDTNVLLDCVRMRPDLCDKLLTLFEKYKERIRIPSQVVFEYHNHAWEESAKNLQIIRNYRSQITDCLVFDNFMPEQYKLFINKDKYVEFQSSFNALKNEITQEIDTQIEFWKNENQKQVILDKIVNLFNDCLLPDVDEETFNERKTEAQRRINEKIPPGFKDKPKRENKEGDYLIWCEILNLAKTENKSIAFISEDLKEDWQKKYKGLNMGPLPDLRKEFYNNAPDCEIHFYTTAKFIEYADPNNDIFSNEDILEITRRRAMLNQLDSNQKGAKNEDITGDSKNKKKKNEEDFIEEKEEEQ